MKLLKVVMRYADGKIKKGYSFDPLPNKRLFRGRPLKMQRTEEDIEIAVDKLKAIFIVKDFTGNPSYTDKNYFHDDTDVPGRKVEVTFTDGEVLVGSNRDYDPESPGFTVIPADPQSNNAEVFVVSSAVSSFRYL